MELVVDNDGKVKEPSTKDKVMALIKRDPGAVVTLPIADIQSIIVNHLYNGSPWLHKYKSGLLEYIPATNSFRVTFFTHEEKKDGN